MPAVLLFLAGVTLWIWAVMAWVTHVIVCIKAASWLLLLVGALVVPVGVIHGTGVWFGAW